MILKLFAFPLAKLIDLMLSNKYHNNSKQYLYRKMSWATGYSEEKLKKMFFIKRSILSLKSMMIKEYMDVDYTTKIQYNNKFINYFTIYCLVMLFLELLIIKFTCQILFLIQ